MKFRLGLHFWWKVKWLQVAGMDRLRFFIFLFANSHFNCQGVKLKNVPKKFEIVIFLKHFLLHF